MIVNKVSTVCRGTIHGFPKKDRNALVLQRKMHQHHILAVNYQCTGHFKIRILYSCQHNPTRRPYLFVSTYLGTGGTQGIELLQDQVIGKQQCLNAMSRYDSDNEVRFSVIFVVDVHRLVTYTYR